MTIARPTVGQERWMQVAARYPALRATVDASGDTGGWKTTTWLGRCLGFLLGLFGVGMLAGVLSPLPEPLLIGGIVLVATAEWLVAKRRVYRSGVEEALYLCGALGIVVQILSWSSGRNEAAGVMFIATAVLLVGWRLLNPLFTTLAAALYAIAIAMIDTSFLGGRLNNVEAATLCIALAIAALCAGRRTWQRPAHDRMLDGLAIAMPWLAYIWLVFGRGDAPEQWLALLVAGAFLLATLMAGVRRRQHSLLLAALGNLVCMGDAVHRLLPWPLHWQLMLAGAALLAVAMLVDRRLRGRAEGLTSAPLQEPASLDLAQLAGTAAIVPAAAESSPGVHGQGGEFGGGGASGRF